MYYCHNGFKLIYGLIDDIYIVKLRDKASQLKWIPSTVNMIILWANLMKLKKKKERKKIKQCQMTIQESLPQRSMQRNREQSINSCQMVKCMFCKPHVVFCQFILVCPSTRLSDWARGQIHLTENVSCSWESFQHFCRTLHCPNGHSSVILKVMYLLVGVRF